MSLKAKLGTEKLGRRQVGKGCTQALHKEKATLKLKNWLVPMRSFHFNKCAAFVMTKLLSKMS